MPRHHQPLLTAVIAAAVSLTLSTGAQGSTGEGRSEVLTETDAGIEISHVRLHDPMPPDAEPHPEACDSIDYLRYRWADGPADPQRSDGVLVGAPGAWFGAYALDRLARNTLRALAARGKTVEWWSVPRRSVCAFDLTGLEAANRARDGRVAFDYYWGGKAVDGQTFAGFRPDSDLGYLADIGLANNVHDIHEVLTRDLPDPEFRRTKAFCGGHSDAGLIMGAFGAWDFGGGPQNAGYNQCAGFFAVDSLIISDPGSTQTNPALASAARLLGSMPYEAAVAALKAGALPRTYNGLPIVAPDTMALLSVLGSAAYHRPEEETDLHRRFPGTPHWELTTRVDFSRTAVDVVAGTNALRDYRFTNEALLGVLLDDNHLNLAPLQMSLGALSGGPTSPKEFPWNDELIRKIPVLGELATAALTGSRSRVGPTDQQALYDWRNYDQVAGVPFTEPSSEVVDIHDFARQLTAAPGGPTGFLDPYYTIRYTLDLAAAWLGARGGELSAMKYDAELKREPIVTIFGTESYTARTDGALAGIPEDTIWAEGYTHVDPVTGAEHQNNGKPEPVSDSLASFTTAHLPPEVGGD